MIRGRNRTFYVVGGLGVALFAAVAAAQTKPAMPPGKPSVGFTIAVLTDGIDYTRAAVQSKLARDGEGVAIAYDAVDDDARPFATGTAATALVEAAPTLVIPIRIDASAATWQRALGFVRRTPARVVVVLGPPPPSDDLRRMILTVPDRLFVLPADPTNPKLRVPNALTVSALPRAGSAPVSAEAADLVLAPAAATREAPSGAAAGPTTAIEAAVSMPGLFACVDVLKARAPAEVIATFVARGARGPAGSAPLVEVCVGR